jgi:ACS family glucarate transporter-like MFS transporter
MLVLMLAPATLIMAMDRSVLTVAAPILQSRFSLTLPQMGLLFTTFFWAYALMQAPAGVFIERFGPRRSLFLAIVLWSAMTFVTPFASSFAALLFIRVLLGVGQSVDWPASIVGINRLFTAPKRPVANSILLCALYAGPVVGAPLTAWLLGHVGLRGVFVICGAIGFVFSAVWWRFYRDGARGATRDQSKLASPLKTGAFNFALRSGGVWILAAAYACTACLVSFYLSWLPTYLMKSRGLALSQMGLYSGVASGALCVSVLAGGRVLSSLTSQGHSLRMTRVPVGVASLVVAAIASLLTPQITSDLLALAAICTSLAALGFSQVATWSVVQDIGGAETGALTGLINLTGNLAAGAAPFVSAIIVERTGSWTDSFLLLGAIGAAGALIWLFVRPDRPLDLAVMALFQSEDRLDPAL